MRKIWRSCQCVKYRDRKLDKLDNICTHSHTAAFGKRTKLIEHLNQLPFARHYLAKLKTNFLIKNSLTDPLHSFSITYIIDGNKSSGNPVKMKNINSTSTFIMIIYIMNIYEHRKEVSDKDRKQENGCQSPGKEPLLEGSGDCSVPLGLEHLQFEWAQQMALLGQRAEKSLVPSEAIYPVCNFELI